MAYLLCLGHSNQAKKTVPVDASANLRDETIGCDPPHPGTTGWSTNGTLECFSVEKECERIGEKEQENTLFIMGHIECIFTASM
jgi:hypothetical protein